ncbi:YicC/YloC family endoribonuclease [Arsenophonus symbiont of Ornithomya chloropus]|uniref:YicC/YloC family endoribonuclease n=1 Tax=Arsenophonus symbiont of Ornithomya chloropus TaxID=634121 RepID=UPI0032B2222B
MIRSMTAFVRLDVKNEWGHAVWEIRSLNQRYLEICVFLPEIFQNLEPFIRDRLRARLTRGKVECKLYFKLNINNKQNEFTLNMKLTKKIINIVNRIKKYADIGNINPLDILRWPGIIVTQTENLDVISSHLLTKLECALDNLIDNRENEGKKLKALIEKRLHSVYQEIKKIRLWMPEILKLQKKRLLNKLKEAEIQIDDNRLAQEIIILAQRIDIDEELDRIEAHVIETCNILNKHKIVGRRLDFIMQEFNREVNTLAGKSINYAVTNSAIELKVLVEQMREQIQNIE